MFVMEVYKIRKNFRSISLEISVNDRLIVFIADELPYSIDGSLNQTKLRPHAVSLDLAASNDRKHHHRFFVIVI